MALLRLPLTKSEIWEIETIWSIGNSKPAPHKASAALAQAQSRPMQTRGSAHFYSKPWVGLFQSGVKSSRGCAFLLGGGGASGVAVEGLWIGWSERLVCSAKGL